MWPFVSLSLPAAPSVLSVLLSPLRHKQSKVTRHTLRLEIVRRAYCLPDSLYLTRLK